MHKKRKRFIVISYANSSYPDKVNQKTEIFAIFVGYENLRLMRLKSYIFIAAAALAAFSCEKNPYGPTGHVPEPEKPAEITKDGFAEGADISWVTQMENDGQKFYDADGNAAECTALMKKIGFDAIRLRVWAYPDDGWCGKEDVLVKAKRAQALGMRIMIDFHFSDSWADPSKQNPPAAWKSYDAVQMKNAVAEHVKEVLGLLKDNGIDVEWVQIGNEVNNGMLWPSGKVQDRDAGNFVAYLNHGYAAVKEVYPKAKVILHVSNGHDSGLFEWFFNLMRLYNASYDIIGMSLYPSWWENGGWNDWKPVVDKCMANIRAMNQNFGKPVMICETGMPVSEPQMSKEAVRYILDEAESIEECHGVFWWEPQTDGTWKPSSYQTLGWNAYDKGAFRNGRPTEALDPFKD